MKLLPEPAHSIVWMFGATGTALASVAFLFWASWYYPIATTLVFWLPCVLYFVANPRGGN